MTLRLFVVAVLVSACTKPEVTPRPYVRVATKSVTVNGSGTVSFEAEIIYNPGKILDHGFVWTELGFPQLNNPAAKKKEMGVKEGTGTFILTVDQGLQPGKTFEMAAYASSPGYVVYGQTISFVVK